MKKNKEHVGFIGLGNMGSNMAKNLLLEGISVTVYDESNSLKEEFKKLGAIFVSKPFEVIKNIKKLFLCLPFTPQIDEVIFGKDGILKEKPEELMIIDTSTIYFDDAINFRSKLDKLNIIYCDCPISGLPIKAKNGTLTMMFGGTTEEYDIILPYLKIMGEKIIHCGKTGSGQLTKAFNNILYNINIAGLCEVLPLAIKAGLKAEVVENLFVSGSSRSFASEYFIPKIMARDFTGDYDMKDAYKDIINVDKVIENIKIKTPMISSMKEIYNKTLEMNLEQRPKSSMIKFFEKELNLKMEKKNNA